MGFFRSLFSDKALAQGIIEANEKTYWKVRRERPGEDEHFYLATTLLRRFEARKKLGQDLGLLNDKENLNLVTFSETQLFSILDPPDSIRALALYIVYEELPSEAHRYEEEFNRIMEPIMRIQEDGTFVDLYRNKNPNTAKEIDEHIQAEDA